MAEEVKQDKYQEETLGANDPIAAFLALKSLTETVNDNTKLRKLGNVMGREESETWPYKNMAQHFRTIQEMNSSFCFGGTLTLNNYDLNLHLHVRDKRYISDLSNASFDARRLNESRPWHDAGYISNLLLPTLQTHCEVIYATTCSPPCVKSVKESKSFRLKYSVPQRHPQHLRTENCPICIVKGLARERDNGDVPMFFQTLQEELRKEFTAGDDVLLEPYKINIFDKDERLEKTSNGRMRSAEHHLGFLVVALPTKHKGGGLHVYNGDTKEEFDFASKSFECSSIQWVAFRSHCKYEIPPVTEGTCTLITYSIHRVPIKFNESKICGMCKPLPPVKKTRFEMNSRKDVGENVKKFVREVRKNIRQCKGKKIGLFLHNRYPMSNFGSDALKGVDHLLHEELEDFDVELTPVLCYIGGVRIANHLMRVNTTFLDEKAVYSFTMDDLDMLKDTKKREMQPDEEIAFMGWNTESDVLLMQGETETVGFPFIEPGKTIRWSYRCAMIISATKKQKGNHDNGGKPRRTSKKKSKRGGRRRVQRNTTEQTQDKGTFAAKKTEDEGEDLDEGSSVFSDSEADSSDFEESEECSACGKNSDDLEEPLKTCSRCHETKYCSRKCQKAHWKAEHKYTCGKYAMHLD